MSANTMKNIIAAGRNIISIQQKQAQTKATLTRVKKKLNALSAKPESDAAKALREGAAEIRADVALVSTLAGEIGGRMEVATEALKSLDAILGAIATGKSTGSTGNPLLGAATTIAAELPNLTEKMTALVAAGRTPIPAELLIERDQLSIDVEYYQKRILIEMSRRDIAFSRLKLLLDAAFQLREGYTLANKYCLSWRGTVAGCPQEIGKFPAAVAKGKIAKLINPKTQSVFSKSEQVAMVKAMLHAIVFFTDAAVLIRKRTIGADRKAQHLQHLVIQLERERAVKAHAALIRGSLADLSAYHSGGIHKKTITEFATRLVNLGLLTTLVST